MGRCGLKSSGLRERPAVSSCEHDNKPLGSIKSGKFLNQLSDYYLLKDQLNKTTGTELTSQKFNLWAN
jgi:hypothetical protein